MTPSYLHFTCFVTKINLLVYNILHKFPLDFLEPLHGFHNQPYKMLLDQYHCIKQVLTQFTCTSNSVCQTDAYEFWKYPPTSHPPTPPPVGGSRIVLFGYRRPADIFNRGKT